MKYILISLLFFSYTAFSQSDETIRMKVRLGINNFSGTWSDTTRNNLWAAINSKQATITNGSISNVMLANGAVANLSGTNTGDNSVNSLYSGLVSNATHTGDATGSTALTLATVNSNVGSFGSATQVPNYTVNGKGLITAAANTTIQIATSQVTNYTGYTLSVQALTSSPTDAQTIYFGNMPKAPTTTAATSKIYIRKAGTIKVAEIYCFSGTAGTNEAWVLSIRVNNTTDTQIASVSAATSERIFSNTGLSIAVSAGDYIEIKSVNPTWATNPLTTIFGGYIYIE